MDDEIYSIVNGFNNYAVSNFGNVINIKSQKMLRQQIKNNYFSVALSSNNIRKSFLVHRLLANAFMDNFDNKKTVNHIDKNKINNNVNNLEFATQKEQNEHNYATEENKRTTNKAKPVLRLDKDTTETLEKYRSLTDASVWLFHNSDATSIESCISGIRNVIIGKSLSCFTYKWKYDITENILENNEQEEWKSIPIEYTNGKENYYISSLGRFKNNNGDIMKNYKSSLYVYIQINKKRHALHRLVALLFIKNPENKGFVNHIDGNKLNNAAFNLEWVTKKENTMHAYKTGLINKYLRGVTQYDKNMILIEKFESIISASKKLNIDKGSIGHVCRGRDKTAGGFIFKYTN